MLSDVLITNTTSMLLKKVSMHHKNFAFIIIMESLAGRFYLEVFWRTNIHFFETSTDLRDNYKAVY